jgi:hypothetical protein
MKRIMVFAMAVVMLLGVTAYAQLPVEILGPGLNSGRTEYHPTWNRTLSPDTLYILTGIYFVDDGYEMTVPAGTVVLGDTASTLVVARGGKLYSMGERFNPVVFSSLKPAGTRAPGDWGGIIILGKAPVNKVEPLIEGGIISGSYGGSDPNDNSGIIRFTRIEYPGYRFQLNNEVNGLTMGGVGAGTEINHVQVSYSFDDSYEWFGGTVDVDHLVALGGTDEDFDTDFGYTGDFQFGFGLRDPFYWDPTGESRGMESDNDGTGSNDAPYTHPIMSNLTLVGPERTNAHVPAPPVASFDYSTVVRRNSRLSLFNSVIMGYPYGLSIRDSGTKTACATNVCQWEDVSIQATLNKGTTAGTCSPAGVSHIHDEGRWPCTDAIAPGVYNWFLAEPGCGDVSTRLPNTVGLVNMTLLTDPDPRPDTGSELRGSANFTHPYLTGFTPTTYRGAFEPDVPMHSQWTRGWTDFDPQNNDYQYGVIFTGTEGPSAPAMDVVLKNRPNPFNPTTTIEFSVPTAGNVTVTVYNVRGELVKTVVDRHFEAGSFEEIFNANDLATGTYFYRIKGNGFTKTAKMVLLK